MRKSANKWLIAAAILVIFGAILVAAVMTAYHWDFSRLSTDQLETNTYEIREDFKGIELNTKTADVRFAASDDGLCRVVCNEPENVKHSVSVRDDALTIRAEDNREWHEHIGNELQSPEITVYLPRAEYESLDITGSTGDVNIPKDFSFAAADISISTGSVELFSSVSGAVKIRTTTGDIRVGNLSAGALELSVSTGEIDVSDVICKGDIKAVVTTGEVEMKNVTCQNLTSSGSTGEIELENTIAAGNISIERSAGDVELEKSDAAEIFIKTDTGHVTGSFLSEKVYITETSTGRVIVPKEATGGRCEIITSTGDIMIGKPTDTDK